MSGGETSTSNPTSGSTLQIDRLLDVMVKQDASDLHITVGRQPTICKPRFLIPMTPWR